MTNYLDCGQLAVIGEYQEVTASDPQSETQIWLESCLPHHPAWIKDSTRILLGR
jgi:hypothetical protein